MNVNEILSTIDGWVTGVVQSLGYVGVALLIALENLIPPIPSELILPLAGSEVARGNFTLPLVILAATVGSITGALILYALGAWLGEPRVRRLIGRLGRFMLMGEDDLDRALRWFERHGSNAVLIGRLIPGVRSLISLPAGIERMSLARFALLTATGSAAWNTLLITLGWLMRGQWETIARYGQVFEYAVLTAVLAAAFLFIARRAGRRPAGKGDSAR